MGILLKGFILGAILASPVGPIGALCLKKNILKDRIHGLVSSLGIAVAYAIVTFCILSGMRYFSDFLVQQQQVLEVLGGAALCYLGIGSFVGKPSLYDAVPTAEKTYVSDFLTTFMMTLFNPVSFVSFTIILTNLGIVAHHGNLFFDVEFALSIFGGTISSWAALNFGIHFFRKYSSRSLYFLIHYTTGLALFLFGVAVLIYAFYHPGPSAAV